VPPIDPPERPTGGPGDRGDGDDNGDEPRDGENQRTVRPSDARRRDGATDSGEATTPEPTEQQKLAKTFDDIIEHYGNTRYEDENGEFYKKVELKHDGKEVSIRHDRSIYEEDENDPEPGRRFVRDTFNVTITDVLEEFPETDTSPKRRVVETVNLTFVPTNEVEEVTSRKEIRTEKLDSESSQWHEEVYEGDKKGVDEYLRLQQEFAVEEQTGPAFSPEHLALFASFTEEIMGSDYVPIMDDSAAADEPERPPRIPIERVGTEKTVDASKSFADKVLEGGDIPKNRKLGNAMDSILDVFGIEPMESNGHVFRAGGMTLNETDRETGEETTTSVNISYIKLSLPNERKDGTRDKNTISERYSLSFTEVLEENPESLERVVTVEEFKFDPTSETPEVIHAVDTLMQQWDADNQEWVRAEGRDGFMDTSESYLLYKQIEERNILTGIPDEKLELLDRMVGYLAGEDADHQAELFEYGLMGGNNVEPEWPEDITSSDFWKIMHGEIEEDSADTSNSVNRIRRVLESSYTNDYYDPTSGDRLSDALQEIVELATTIELSEKEIAKLNYYITELNDAKDYIEALLFREDLVGTYNFILQQLNEINRVEPGRSGIIPFELLENDLWKDEPELNPPAVASRPIENVELPEFEEPASGRPIEDVELPDFVPTDSVELTERQRSELAGKIAEVIDSDGISEEFPLGYDPEHTVGVAVSVKMGKMLHASGKKAVINVEEIWRLGHRALHNDEPGVTDALDNTVVYFDAGMRARVVGGDTRRKRMVKGGGKLNRARVMLTPGEIQRGELKQKRDIPSTTAHELKHIAQLERLGPVKFNLLYQAYSLAVAGAAYGAIEGEEALVNDAIRVHPELSEQLNVTGYGLLALTAVTAALAAYRANPFEHSAFRAGKEAKERNTAGPIIWLSDTKKRGGNGLAHTASV